MTPLIGGAAAGAVLDLAAVFDALRGRRTSS